MATTFIQIASTTLGADAASITFSGIPSTYTDLYIIGTYRGANASVNSNLWARYNNDSAANYGWSYIYGNNGTASATSTGGANYDLMIYGGPGNTNTSTYWSSFWSYIGDYQKTTAKQTLTFSTRITPNNTGDSYATGHGGQWRSSSAITSIVYVNSTGSNILAGTSITIYGISAS